MGIKIMRMADEHLRKAVSKVFPEYTAGYVCHCTVPGKNWIWCTRKRGHTGIHVDHSFGSVFAIWGTPSIEDFEAIDRVSSAEDGECPVPGTDVPF